MSSTESFAEAMDLMFQEGVTPGLGGVSLAFVDAMRVENGPASERIADLSRAFGQAANFLGE